MAKTLKNLTINRVALVPAGSNPQADVVLFKNKPEVSPQPKEPVFMKKNIDVSKLSPEEQAALSTLLSKSATDIADPEPPVSSDPVEDVMKSLPPAAQAIMKQMQEQTAEAVRKAEEATAAALFEKHAREENEFAAANVDLVKSYPGVPDASARLMHRVKKALKSDADYAALETLIKAGSAALSAGMTERGSSVGSASSSTDGDELIAKAKQLMKDKNMSYSEAYAQVLDENPDTVAAIRKASAKRRRVQDDNDND